MGLENRKPQERTAASTTNNLQKKNANQDVYTKMIVMKVDSIGEILISYQMELGSTYRMVNSD